MEESGYWQTTWLKRISRRRLIQGSALGAAGLAAASLIGCGDDDATTSPPEATGQGTPATVPSGQAGINWPPPPAYTKGTVDMFNKYHWSKIGQQTKVLGTPQRGGVLVATPPGFGMTSLHPSEETAGQYFFGPSHMGMISIDFSPTGNLDSMPVTTNFSLSESFETPDATTFVFKMRPGSLWHNKPPANGEKVTVEDVRATYELFKKSRFHGTNFQDLATVTEPQAGTIRITTSKPAVQMIGYLKSPQYAVLNAKHILEGDDALKTKAIGTGAFTQEKFDYSGGVRVYKRNPNWWYKADQPFLDGVVLRVIRDPAASVAAFRTGQADYYRPTSPEEFNRLLSELDPWAEVSLNNYAAPWHLQPSLRDPMFKDVRVRRAMSMAIDREALINSAFGGLGTVASTIPWFWRGRAWTETAQEMGQWHKFDLNGAKQLLSQAGIQPGTKVPLQFQGQINPGLGTQSDPQIDFVQQSLKALGLEVELKPHSDQLAARRAFFAADWNGLFVYSTVSSSLDPDLWAQPALSGSTLNGTGITDSRVDELFQKQRATVNVKDREKVFDDLETYIEKENLLRGVPLVSSLGLAMWRKYLHNFVESPIAWLNAQGSGQSVEGWLDERAAKRNIDSY